MREGGRILADCIQDERRVDNSGVKVTNPWSVIVNDFIDKLFKAPYATQVHGGDAPVMFIDARHLSGATA